MKPKTFERSTIVALATTLVFTVSGHAFAQSAGLPPVETQGAIKFVSGGIGDEESKAMRLERNRWPLSLDFLGPASDYLADVNVRITNSKGNQVLQADSNGPFMLVKLPPGRYTVYARYKSDEQRRTVNVSRSGHGRASFRFSSE
jgi:hypothetical protein